MEKEFELITPKRFKAFALTHQALLFPAFQMQLSLQRKVLGEGSWKKHIKSRSFICDNAYVSVTELISSVCSSRNSSLKYRIFHLFIILCLFETGVSKEKEIIRWCSCSE